MFSYYNGSFGREIQLGPHVFLLRHRHVAPRSGQKRIGRLHYFRNLYRTGELGKKRR